MRLGHFTDFKSRPSVILLSTMEPNGFRQFHGAIRALATGDSVSIHTLSGVRVCEGISLNVAHCDSESLSSASAGAFTWRLDNDALLEVLDKIEPLMHNCDVGHQYFDYPEITIVMSLGEYDDAWWQQQFRI